MYHAVGRGRPGHGSPQNAFFQAGAGAIEQCGISPLPLHAPGAPRSNAYMIWCMIRERHGTPTPDTREMGPDAMRFSIRTVRWMYADKVVNCIGACQAPMLTIDVEMKVLESGQVMQVMTDDPDLAERVRAWADENGHMIEEEHVVAGVTTLIMRKEAAAGAEAK